MGEDPVAKAESEYRMESSLRDSGSDAGESAHHEWTQELHVSDPKLRLQGKRKRSQSGKSNRKS